MEDAFFFILRRGAAQQRLDAGDQLTHGERLGDIVVRAQLEAEDLIHLVALGGQHDDGDVRSRRRALEPPAHFHAINAGEHDIQQHHRGTLMRTDYQRVFARRGGHDPVPRRLEIEREQFKDVSLVVNGQNKFVCHARILFLSCTWYIDRRFCAGITHRRRGGACPARP